MKRIFNLIDAIAERLFPAIDRYELPQQNESMIERRLCRLENRVRRERMMRMRCDTAISQRVERVERRTSFERVYKASEN